MLIPVPSILGRQAKLHGKTEKGNTLEVAGTITGLTAFVNEDDGVIWRLWMTPQNSWYGLGENAWELVEVL